MSILKIPEAIRKFLEEADFVSLATSDRNGQPNAANNFILKVESDIIYIVDFIKGKAWENLRYNPFISLTVMDKDNLRDYRINGTATMLENGSEYDLLMKEFSEKEIRFAINRVIEGVQRTKPHHSFSLPFPQQASIIKVKVDRIIEIAPTAEPKKESKVIMNGKKDFPASGIYSRFVKKAKYYLSQHSQATLLIGLSLVFSIGIIDYFTGYEIGVSSFYLIPIIMVTWGLDRKTGLYMAILSMATWIAAEGMARGVRFSISIILWNASIRLTFFLVIVQLLSSLKIRFQKEQEFSSHDYLTGTVNSRYFFNLAERELKRMVREKKSFTLAYLDIDNFKQINDSVGHPAGDSLLKLVATTLEIATREIDIVARLGGDEFAILMPLTGYEEAEAVISRVRRKLKDSRREHTGDISCSIGLVTFIEPAISVDEMIRLADAQMYRAKRKGKDRVEHVIFDKSTLQNERLVNIFERIIPIKN